MSHSKEIVILAKELAVAYANDPDIWDKIDTTKQMGWLRLARIVDTKYSVLLNTVHFIATDYGELSHEKVQLQRDDYTQRARKALMAFHST